MQIKATNMWPMMVMVPPMPMRSLRKNLGGKIHAHRPQLRLQQHSILFNDILYFWHKDEEQDGTTAAKDHSRENKEVGIALLCQKQDWNPKATNHEN
mmetsp:Transcript_4515/g.9490  ORF Transcript_4515/g.9490 Transcript_4515/m.9490 type:complete len:97 (+) Transcript_4515:648-938(+)